QIRPFAEVRKIDVIQRIEAQAREVGPRAEDLEGREGKLRIARIADRETRMPFLAIHAGADLPPVAELPAEVEPVVERMHAVLGALALPEEERQVGRGDRDMRHDEPAGEL